MDNILNILRSALILVFLIVFLSGCGKESEPSPKPKVVTGKITMAKKAESRPVNPVKSKTAIKIPVSKKVLSKPGPLKIQPKKKMAESIHVNTDKKIVKSRKTVKKTGLAVASVTSEKKPGIVDSTGVTKIDIHETTGFYSPEGKVDPFEPLFKEKPVVVFPAQKKKLKRRTPLTPLEKVDLSQLKLTGIIQAPSGNLAMVEEASGKGYIVKKGTYIGTHAGRIVQILRDRVIVEEKSEDIYGKIVSNKKILQLQKPPGE